MVIRFRRITRLSGFTGQFVFSLRQPENDRADLTTTDTLPTSRHASLRGRKDPPWLVAQTDARPMLLIVAHVISDQLIGVPKTSKDRACDDWCTEFGTWCFEWLPGRQCTSRSAAPRTAKWLVPNMKLASRRMRKSKQIRCSGRGAFHRRMAAIVAEWPTGYRILFTLVLTSAGLAGCTVGPDFVAPAQPRETNYVMGQAATVSTQASGDTRQEIQLGDVLEADWWTRLRSTELDRTVTLALSNNRTL